MYSYPQIPPPQPQVTPQVKTISIVKMFIITAIALLALSLFTSTYRISMKIPIPGNKTVSFSFGISHYTTMINAIRKSGSFGKYGNLMIASAILYFLSLIMLIASLFREDRRIIIAGGVTAFISGTLCIVAIYKTSPLFATFKVTGFTLSTGLGEAPIIILLAGIVAVVGFKYTLPPITARPYAPNQLAYPYGQAPTVEVCPYCGSTLIQLPDGRKYCPYCNVQF